MYTEWQSVRGFSRLELDMIVAYSLNHSLGWSIKVVQYSSVISFPPLHFLQGSHLSKADSSPCVQSRGNSHANTGNGVHDVPQCDRLCTQHRESIHCGPMCWRRRQRKHKQRQPPQKGRHLRSTWWSVTSWQCWGDENMLMACNRPIEIFQENLILVQLTDVRHEKNVQ